MTSGPQICQLVKCYEDSVSDNTKTSHHEDVPSEQKKFLQDIKEMTETIKEYGNPFLEESRELVSLDNNMVSHTETLDQFEPKGIKQFQNFRNNVNNNLFYSPIKKNNYQIFQSSHES